MKKLFKNGSIIDVLKGEIVKADLLVEDDMIIGVGEYNEADEIIDVSGKYLCPGFIDSHIHIESTMMTPAHMAKAMIPHGTCAIVADPHEIANVCGTRGLQYMLEDSEGLPLTIYFALPSCVPAAYICESGAILKAEDLRPFYSHPRVIALGEVMNYPGVINGDPDVLEKIADAKKFGKIINGHAPLLSGEGLKKYVDAGIGDDHECSRLDEAIEKYNLGQWIFIREASAAFNLEALMGLFAEPYKHRCCFCSDDVHYAELYAVGHIDKMISRAVGYGGSVITAIQMSTINPATYYKLDKLGALAPGYKANVVVFEDLEKIDVQDVYLNGQLYSKDKKLIDFKTNRVDKDLYDLVHHSFNIKKLNSEDFYIEPKGNKVRLIEVINGQLITKEAIEELDFSKNNGISVENKIYKIAVCERHKGTGHIGLAYLKGLDLAGSSLACSVGHDDHNLIVVGCNEEDMAIAANHVIEQGGGQSAVADGKVIISLALPVAGLMSDKTVEELFAYDKVLTREGVDFDYNNDTDPYTLLSFMSLPVIPKLKLTTHGLFDVDQFKLVDLFVKD